MILKAYKIDNDGFYTEDYIYEEEQELGNNIVTKEMPEGLIKSKWNGREWIEGATQEYKDGIKSALTSTLTLEERISMLENLQLQQEGVI